MASISEEKLMPNRILRDGILTSSRVTKLNWAEEVFYRRLHSVVDDFGRHYADHGLLRAACYPRQLNKVSDSDIEKWLRACVDAALVRVYPAKDGERYLVVLDFKQQVRATKSKYPQPPSECAADATQVQSNAHLDVDGDVVGIPDADASGVPGAAGSVLPDCPHEKIVDLYHELLPCNPRVLEWHETRRGYLRARWKQQAAPNGKRKGYKTEAEGLAWWRDFLEWVGQSQFLTGQADGKDGKPPFIADLEWIVRPTNFAKVIEGKYHRAN